MVRNWSDLKIAAEHLARALKGEEPLFLDGAMGTMLMQAGALKLGEISDLLCLTRPELVTSIHAAYVEAGAQVITTNTFNGNARHLKDAATVTEVYAAAAQCAREAGAPYVAGDVGPLGEFLYPYGDIEEDEAYDLFAEQMRAIEAAGCDLVIIETMTHLDECLIAVRAAVENTSLPVLASMTYRDNGISFMGSEVCASTRALAEAGANAVGMNCSLTPDTMVNVARSCIEAARPYGIPVMAQPNAGRPETNDGKPSYSFTPEEFKPHMAQMAADGATILGSCCGTTPDYTRAIIEAVASR